MNLLKKFFSVFKVKGAYAHCDIPCGIYDPYAAQLAAVTVVRMTEMIVQADQKDKELIHHLARLTRVKEEHAEIVKREVRIIWGDFFKPEHVETNPELHALVFEIMKLASKSKQTVAIEVANNLVSKVQEFAALFWKTKGVKTQVVKAPSPSGGEMVVPTT